MTSPKPHYLLFCDGNIPAHGESAGAQRGRWRFVLEDLATGERIEATDQEVACAPDRSALVAVLRGLEALEQPSRVTLVTTSRYVTRGLQYGLSEWRDNDYSWEHFGTVQPIRNADIWKRIDRALAFHQVQCRWMAQEASTETNEDSVLDLESTDSKVELAPHIRTTVPVATIPVATAPVATVLAVQSAHRSPRKVDVARSMVSTSKYQRVYVDTPIAESASIESKRCELRENTDVALGEATSLKRKKQQSSYSLSEKTSCRYSRFAYLFLLPFRMAYRGPHWLCSHSWAAILAIDEWLESFLRCLFLLDPGKRATRR